MATERNQIRSQQAKLNEAVATKNAECADLTKQAQTARDTHIQVATEQTQAAQLRLAQMRRDQDSAMSKVREERMKTDNAAAAAAAENSSGEFRALINLLKTQLYAQFIAVLIFMGLFIIDVLPLTLRIFARPGAYDHHKRADDEIRRMKIEGELAETRLFHLAHKTQVDAEDFQRQITGDMRPHIRSVIMNKMDRRKQQEEARNRQLRQARNA